MRKLVLISLFFSLAIKLSSQVSSVNGNISDENGVPIGYAPVVLLFPSDSTMAYFAVTSDKGVFDLKGAKDGRYLLQVSYIGHQTIYKTVNLPLEEGGNLGTIVMKTKPVTLGEVVVAEEYIPLQFKRDTIEYNTAAFNTKPDAVVEDLIKKLPGMEVDRAGNIKAMGEDVKKVLVDGKEFFGSDPKLATRNVPADALRKIQVYDKRSDESEFTGIDDGTRNKTLNLMLKEDKKNALFGELTAGGGIENYYLGNAKVYKFTKKNQFASLGMLNNINQFGFSFKDYIDFSGGIPSLGGHGGSVQIKLGSGGSSSFPVNFGQPVNGLSASGAGGLNFSHEFKKDSRIFMSYVANGSDRDLIQNTSSRNFTDINSYFQEDNLNENKRDIAQRLNFGLRNRIDSTRNIIVNGSASISYGKTISNHKLSVFDGDNEKNRLSSGREDKAKRFSGDISGSYLKLIDRGNTVFRLSSDASYSKDLGNNFWTNEISQFDPVRQILGSQFQDNRTNKKGFSANTSITRKLGSSFYIEPELKAGIEDESMNRTQGNPGNENVKIDSLSPGFERLYQWFRPEVRLIRNTEKTQLTLGLEMELGKIANSLNKDKLVENSHIFFTPSISWEYEYKTSRRLRLNYQTNINVASVSQLLPVVNISNPLALSWGNRNLKPEVSNRISANWWIFDQFSFTSFMSGLSMNYTTDKINWRRTIDDQFKQTMSLTNVPNDYSISGNVDFSTPVRKLGIKINSNIEETWNKGLSYINEIENTNTNYGHKISLSLENRKKTKWDITLGGAVQVTDSKFSIQESLNNRYLDLSWFSELRYNPNKKWNFQFTTDVTKYNSDGFTKSVSVPLLGAEASYYFLKNNRGVLTLNGTDLLNRNTGIERVSELNFLREQRSNMLGRFFMLSFKYRLNKFGDAPGGIDIKINGKR